MSQLATIRARSQPSDILEGQPQHAGLAALLTIGALSLIAEPDGAPALLGLTAAGWARLSIALALVHQVLVAGVFRLQLHRNLMTRLFGPRDMTVWAALFLPLLAARPLTVLLTGWADTVPITPYRGAEIALGLALLAAAAWAIHSTLVHFTIPRALEIGRAHV